MELASKEAYYEQKIVNEFVVIIDGVISEDSLGAELEEISTISTTPPITDEAELGEYAYLLKGKKGRVVLTTDNTAIEEYIYQKVKKLPTKVPIALNNQLVLSKADKEQKLFPIHKKDIKSVKYVKPDRATEKYGMILVFGVVEIELK